MSANTMSAEAENHLHSVPCPLCNSAKVRFVMSGEDLLHRTTGTFILSRCLNCAHVYVNPPPSQKSIAEYYPENYGPHQSEQSNSHPEQKAEDESREPLSPSPPWYLSNGIRSIPGLKAFYYWLTEDRSFIIPAPPFPQARALDLGCGTGEALELLRNHDWEAEGIELNSIAAQTARNKGFQVHTGSLEDFDAGPGKFHAVLSSMVLEHLHNPRSTAQKLYELLAPQGQLMISVPNYGSWERLFFGRYWHGLDLPRHLQHFTPRTIRQLLQTAGFQDVRVIHQRNWNQVAGSLGLWLRETRIAPQLGEHLLTIPHRPSLKSNLVLAPLAHIAAFLRQSGRLTVLARKP